MFKLDYSTATVKRLAYVTDTQGNKKSTYSSSDITAKGYLIPTSVNTQDVGLDRFWLVYNFECDYPFAVKESDIVSIDWIDYKVKSVARFKGIRIDRVRVVLVKEKTE